MLGLSTLLLSVAGTPEPPPIDIVPVTCFASYCSFEESFLAIGAPQLILLAGAFIVNRWRDVILVGAVTTLAVFAGTLTVGGWDDLGRDLSDVAYNVAFVFALTAAIAAVVQLAKRLVVWSVRQIFRDPRTFVSSMIE